MVNLFNGCSAFDKPLNGWDVSRVVNIGGMFQSCGAFDQPLDQWNVAGVSNMDLTFSHAYIFNQVRTARVQRCVVPYDIGTHTLTNINI